MDTSSDQFNYPPEKIISIREFIRDFLEVNKRPGAAPFCFIIGSGASYKAGIPTGAQLVDRWMLELFNTEGPEVERIPIPPDQEETFGSALLPSEEKKVREWAEKNLLGQRGFDHFEWKNRANYYGALYARRYRSNPSLGPVFLRQHIVGKRPTAGYLLLARILARSLHRVVVTTNFDRLTEDAVAQSKGTAALTLGHDKVARYLDHNFGLPIVAKIHGDIFLETYNATEDIAELRAEWKDTLRKVFQIHTPVIIGYGGNDPGLMRYLAEHGDDLFNDRSFYWCYYEPEGLPQNELVKQLAKLRGFRLVPIKGFDEIMVRLNEALGYEPLLKDLEETHASLRAQIQKAMEEISGGQPLMKSIEEGGEPPSAPAQPLPKPSPTPAPASSQEKAPAQGVVTEKQAHQKLPDWRAWNERIWKEPTEERRMAMLDRALVACPGSIALRSFRTRLKAESQPNSQALLNEAKAIWDEGVAKLGPEHEETLESLCNLGIQLRGMGELTQAEPLLRRALEARERTLGPEHPDTLRSLNNLAVLLKDKGDLPGAEPLFRRALEVQERTLGPEHPDTLSSLNNLAGLLKDKGDLAGAEPLHRRAFDVMERTLWPEHPNTLGGLNDLANLLAAKGDLLGAEPLYRRALEAQERTLGPEHPDTLRSLNNLAFLLADKGDLAEADPLAERAALGFLAKLGPKHRHTKVAHNNLANFRRERAEGGK